MAAASAAAAAAAAAAEAKNIKRLQAVLGRGGYATQAHGDGDGDGEPPPDLVTRPVVRSGEHDIRGNQRRRGLRPDLLVA